MSSIHWKALEMPKAMREVTRILAAAEAAFMAAVLALVASVSCLAAMVAPLALWIKARVCAFVFWQALAMAVWASRSSWRDWLYLSIAAKSISPGIKFFRPLVFSSSSFSGILLSGILNILGIAASTPFFSTLKIELIDLYFVEKYNRIKNENRGIKQWLLIKMFMSVLNAESGIFLIRPKSFPRSVPDVM